MAKPSSSTGAAKAAPAAEQATLIGEAQSTTVAATSATEPAEPARGASAKRSSAPAKATESDAGQVWMVAAPAAGGTFWRAGVCWIREASGEPMKPQKVAKDLVESVLTEPRLRYAKVVSGPEPVQRGGSR